MNGADFPYNNRQAVTHHDQLLQQQQQPSLLPQRLPLQHQQSYSYPSPSNIQAGTHQPSASEFDRSFVPDNMVPGLRPSRSRDQSLHQLPINVQNSQNHGPTSYLDEAREREREREHFLQQQQRLQHQGSWEQLQLQNQGGRPASVGAGPNSFNPNPVSHIQPLSQGPPRLSSGAMQLNALRQSPNHLLQQQQLLRNARNGFDSFSSQQFSGLDRMNGGGGQNGMGMNLNGAPQQFGNGGLNISPTGPNGSSSRLYDSLPNQAFVASNGLSSNGAALAGYDFPPPRQQEAPNRMLASSAGGGGLRDLDGGLRLGQNGMYNGGAPSLQQQHLLQQLQPNPNGMQFGGGGNNMAAHQQQPQALSQLHGVGGSAGLRPVNPVASLPNDFMMAPNQSFSGNRSYNVGVGGNMGMSMPLPPQQQQHLQQLHHHHPQQQQNQPDLMALLMGRQPPYRGE
ncbi:hypothetical protein DL93DRAFT_1822245 [Clavulina sp. PMI_390]|nr:hypothetical protein DL93DRAFT_1822245 [Clavulina sp. PMI_390]